MESRNFYFKALFAIISIVVVCVLCSGCIKNPSAESATPVFQPPTQTPGATDPGTIQPDAPVPGNTLRNPNESQNSGPIRVTIHSALKTSKIKDTRPLPGNIYVIINMTIENLAGNDSFTANENTVDITGGGPITQKLYEKLSNPFYWGTVPPQSKRTGEIVFGVKESTDQFNVTLLDETENVILSTVIGTIPDGTYGESMVPANVGQGTTASQNARTINLTIHSTLKTTKIKDTRPLPGNIYVVMNMTIENLAEKDPFTANENTVDITGGGPMTQKIYDKLSNPFYWGTVPPKSSRTGEIVFGVKESTDQFTVTLLDERGTVLLTRPVGTISTGPYLPALENSAILTSTNFSSLVESLDTPAKATQYSDAHFTFIFHDGCTSYPPEAFFHLGKGDCKDYATFLSYVLAHHGYNAQIVAFKYFKDGTRHGHVVTLFTDSDGAMYYMTTPDVSVMRSVTSVEDLLKKECARLGVPTIANHTVVPAGSLNTCVL